ncbi:MAG TPA: rhamnulokinase family protein [Armatimonadota bacterium]|jgi:rhamnulokinase
MAERRYLAFDLGAESGRAVAGTLADGRLVLEELHRFPNEPVLVGDTLHWDILSLYRNVLQGMRAYVERYGASVESVGIDSWSVDFGLLAGDELVGNPVHYRDRRTEGMVEVAAKRMPLPKLYELTGMAPNQIHTAFQLLAMRREGSALLGIADRFLMIPDLLANFLCGSEVGERTNAIHSQLYNPRHGEWERQVFKRLDLPWDIMPPLVDPGTTIGALRESVQQATGFGPVPVVAPCTHDTGSAVAAVPFGDASGAFLSSGTWSVLGAMTAEPVTTAEALAARVSNELSLEPFICRNIMGLWLLQECRRAGERAGESYGYEELARLAESAPAGGPLLVPDAPDFLAPPDMPEAIRAYCRRTGQEPPADVAALVRCVLESLALSYRHGLEQFGRILGRRFEVLHIVGGGCQNALLCQLAADALQLPVTAGPVEATVAGNLLVQALGRGQLASVAELREVVRRSFAPLWYEPRGNLDAQYERYLGLLR